MSPAGTIDTPGTNSSAHASIILRGIAQATKESMEKENDEVNHADEKYMTLRESNELA